MRGFERLDYLHNNQWDLKMSNLIQHAKMELDAIGLTEDSPDEMNQMMRKHILKMVQVFADEGHSGFSASYALSVLTRLLDFKPLGPLTGEDSEWVYVGDDGVSPVYQNKRCSFVFKGAEGAYNINGKVFWEWFKDEETGEYFKSSFTNSDSRVPVEFPYVIPKEPEYIYAGEGSEEARLEEFE